MENKEVEQKLQESVENIELREFSEVWEEIKDRIESAPTPKKKKLRWLPAVAAVAGIAVICVVTIPLLNSSPSTGDSSITYLRDQLEFVPTSMEEFNKALAEEQIACFDFTEYAVTSTSLYKTSTGIAKGGKLELTDDITNSTIYLTVQLYNMDVVVDKLEEIAYDKQYSINGIVFEYTLTESYTEYGIYIYEIKTEYQATQYYMKYTCGDEDITPFLGGLFD